MAVVEAGLLAAQLATASDNGQGIHTAVWAIDQALKVAPINELLIRAAMELHALNEDREAADRLYQHLCKNLAKDDLEPESATTETRHRIMRAASKLG